MHALFFPTLLRKYHNAKGIFWGDLRPWPSVVLQTDVLMVCQGPPYAGFVHLDR